MSEYTLTHGMIYPPLISAKKHKYGRLKIYVFNVYLRLFWSLNSIFTRARPKNNKQSNGRWFSMDFCIASIKLTCHFRSNQLSHETKIHDIIMSVPTWLANCMHSWHKFSSLHSLAPIIPTVPGTLQMNDMICKTKKYFIISLDEQNHNNDKDTKTGRGSQWQIKWNDIHQVLYLSQSVRETIVSKSVSVWIEPIYTSHSLVSPAMEWSIPIIAYHTYQKRFDDIYIHCHLVITNVM